MGGRSMLNWLFGPRVQHIHADELKTLMKSENPPVIVDVRTHPEFRESHIPKAVHIPLPEVRTRMDELPKEKVIVTVCRTGHRSLVAAQALQSAGYQVKNLQGGMELWTGDVVPRSRR